MFIIEENDTLYFFVGFAHQQNKHCRLRKINYYLHVEHNYFQGIYYRLIIK